MTHFSRHWLIRSALAVAGCFGVATTPATAQTVSLQSGNQQVNIRIGDDAILPADFPADIVLPQPHVLTQVQNTGPETAVELEVSADPVRTAAEFRASMLINGWSPARVVAPAEGIAQAWVKESRAVTAWTTALPTGSHLTLRLLPRR